MFKCMECNQAPVLEENGVCPYCAYELKSFMDRIVSICKNAGKNVWGESPAEMVAEIVNERDELKERVKELEKTLRPFADSDNWTTSHHEDSTMFNTVWIGELEPGYTARKVLSGVDGQICRYCLSSALSVSVQDGDTTYYHCAGCDRDDLTADDLWDEDEFIAETLPGDGE